MLRMINWCLGEGLLRMINWISAIYNGHGAIVSTDREISMPWAHQPIRGQCWSVAMEYQVLICYRSLCFVFWMISESETECCQSQLIIIAIWCNAPRGHGFVCRTLWDWILVSIMKMKYLRFAIIVISNYDSRFMVVVIWSHKDVFMTVLTKHKASK